MLRKRQSLLKDVERKLAEIDSYIKSIMNHLNEVNLNENSRLKSIEEVNDRAIKHKRTILAFAKKFEERDAELRKQHQQFAHFFKEERTEIPDQQLVELTDSSISLFDSLEALSKLSYEYNKEELLPLVQEMAEMAKQCLMLSRTSKFLSKMYAALCRGVEELNKIGVDVDTHSGADKKLQDIIKADEFEAKVTKRAYMKSNAINYLIKDGYSHLGNAYGYLRNSVSRQDDYLRNLQQARADIAHSLNLAFKIVLHSEIKQARKEEAELGRSEQDLRGARRAETRAV
jgi:hypothetical protein